MTDPIPGAILVLDSRDGAHTIMSNTLIDRRRMKQVGNAEKGHSIKRSAGANRQDVVALIRNIHEEQKLILEPSNKPESVRQTRAQRSSLWVVQYACLVQ
jgi:hypothetical protein